MAADAIAVISVDCMLDVGVAPIMLGTEVAADIPSVKSCADTEAVSSPMVMGLSMIHPVQELMVKTSKVISVDFDCIIVVSIERIMVVFTAM